MESLDRTLTTQSNINLAYEMFLSQLAEDNIITEEQFRKASMYRAIIAKKNWLGRLFNQWFKLREDIPSIIIVKVASYEQRKRKETEEYDDEI